eukprot:COSAG02_NODE_12318_length_1563_cov_4.388087_2_plen_93_part_00
MHYFAYVYLAKFRLPIQATSCLKLCGRCADRLRRAVEIWLSEAGIGGNNKSSSLRGFDTGPLLEFADREHLLGNTIATASVANRSNSDPHDM